MKITETHLRRIIQSEIKLFREGPNDSSPAAPSTGKDIKGGAAAGKATEKLESNPAIKKALDQITTADGLASFLQAALKMASEKGIDNNEIKTALKKVASAVMAAK